MDKDEFTDEENQNKEDQLSTEDYYLNDEDEEKAPSSEEEQSEDETSEAEEAEEAEEEVAESEDDGSEEEETDDGFEEVDSDEEEPSEKKKFNWKKFGIVSGVIIGVLVIAYLGTSIFFLSHFYFNTVINGQSFSAKKVEDVENYLKDQVKGYSLTILEKNDQTDVIDGKNIDLKYVENDDIQDALDAQNAFLWPQAFFSQSSNDITINVSYDADELSSEIEQLKAVTGEQTEPVSAYPKYNGTEFVVEPEVTGTKVEREVLDDKINEFITEFRSDLDMEEEGCYALPKYTADSPEVQDACDEMNKYLKASITYPMDPDVVVDKDLISEWVTADADLKVTFNEDAVYQWLLEFGDTYDTYDKTRTITSPTGKVAEVPPGTYGWAIDEDAEYEALINSIKSGEVATREPAYYTGQTAVNHTAQDWGNTYLEVDLTNQHMWYIVNGGIALESDVVTGYPSAQKATPAGTYSILQMESPSVLKGQIDPATNQPEYETQVAYWMRVTWSGVGFHDATWQPAFGGSVYTWNGSHGCINMPYSSAQALYSMLAVGTPVLMHY